MSTPVQPEQRTGRHPLDPLDADEVSATSSILIRDRELDGSVRFVSVELHEPPKQAVLDHADGPRPDREAFVVLRDRKAMSSVEAIVSLTREEVVSWREIPGRQPAFTRDELDECVELILTDPAFAEAMSRRGVTDLSLVDVDLWSAGHPGTAERVAEARLIRALAFVRSGRFDNRYARPAEGLVVLVDLDRMRVLEVADHGVVPLPAHPGNYIPELVTGEIEGYGESVPSIPAVREAPRPIEITQPDGPSFTVEGHAVSWQNWRLRVGYTPREGLVLHQVGYQDGARVRPILYRASLSELFVPYGDPNPTHRIKNVFDIGEWGAGPLLNYLLPGCDCVGHIRYFDVVVNDADGNPRTLPNAICMHEEDYGVLWKHADGALGHAETRRNRRLVVSCWFTANNYDYGFFWYLYLDGTIEFEVKLTGIVSTGAFPADGPPPPFGTVLAPGLYAPNHEHFFNVRLDMCVDGPGNSVYETNPRALAGGPDNPASNAWVAHPTLLASESRALRQVDPLAGRYWTVVNPRVRNRIGQPVGYKLLPGENIRPLGGADSQTGRRAGFTAHHLWVTAHDPAQRYAAGDYPNQHPHDDGLPSYVRGDRPLVDADVVLWYTFGARHVPRIEDWPVMPATSIGFHLKPAGFFDGNPARDLPRPQSPTHQA